MFPDLYYCVPDHLYFFLFLSLRPILLFYLRFRFIFLLISSETSFMPRMSFSRSPPQTYHCIIDRICFFIFSLFSLLMFATSVNPFIFCFSLHFFLPCLRHCTPASSIIIFPCSLLQLMILSLYVKTASVFLTFAFVFFFFRSRSDHVRHSCRQDFLFLNLFPSSSLFSWNHHLSLPAFFHQHLLFMPDRTPSLFFSL